MIAAIRIGRQTIQGEFLSKNADGTITIELDGKKYTGKQVK